MMKDCKFCCSEVNQRARVCPVCHKNISFMGVLASFFLTAFPILTALVSLGFAFYEKYEKFQVQETLTKVEDRLDVVEIRNEVAQDAVTRLSKIAPQERSLAPNPGAAAEAPVEEQIRKIEQSFNDELAREVIDLGKLKSLERRKLEIQNGRNIFSGNR